MTTTTTLQEQLIHRLTAFYGLGPGVTADSRLREDLALDSVDLTHLELLLEHLYTVPVTPADIAACRTVGDLARLLESKTALHP